MVRTRRSASSSKGKWKPNSSSAAKRNDRVTRSKGSAPPIFPFRKKTIAKPKEELKCVPWRKLTKTQKSSIERIRRNAFPGKRGDTITCLQWTKGNIGIIPGMDVRDTTLRTTQKNHSVVAAVKRGRVLGYAAWLDYTDMMGKPCTFLSYLAVKESHRLQGVGRFLMGKFSERGASMNLIGVLNSVDGALGFYKKMGWSYTPKTFLKAGKGFNMDYPEKIVGKKVRFKFRDGKWYSGDVKKYNGGPTYDIYVGSLKRQKLAAYHVEQDISSIRVVSG